MLNTHRRTVAAVAVAAIIALCGHLASSSDTVDAASRLPVTIVDVPLDWGDDLNHFIVTGAPPANDQTTTTAHSAPDDDQIDVSDDPTGGQISGALPAGAVGPVTLILADTDDERAAAAQLPDGYTLAMDDAGNLWGWSADGTWWDLGGTTRAGSAPVTVEAAHTGPSDRSVIGPVPASDSEFIDLLVRSGLFHDIRPLGQNQAAVATDAVAARVAAVDGIVAVDDDLLLQLAGAATNDADFTKQWMLDNTGATSQAGGWSGVADADMDVPAAWGVATGDGVVVAVIDSGVTTNHPDLVANLWHPPGEVCGNGVDDDGNGHVDDCNGWNFGSGHNDPNPGDDSGRNHGTHVAGIIAATANNNIGVVGVAPSAQVMALRVSRDNGSIAASAVLAAVRYAIANGADVINVSLATVPGTPRANASALETAVTEARAAGILITAGTGNDGTDTTGAATVWPAGFSDLYDNVIAVGASTNSDTRANFSNWGSALDVHAPGYFIWSTIDDANSYGWMSGTSMAAPAVAATAALMLDQSPAATPSQLRSTLIATSDHTAAGLRVNAATAVGTTEVASGEMGMTVSGLDTLAGSQRSTITPTVTATEAAGAANVRLSFATLDGGDVLAVDGLSVTRPGGAEITTGTDGTLPLLAVDGGALTSGGHPYALELALPNGTYALVAELVAPNGTRVTAPVHVAFTVSDQATSDPLPLPDVDPTPPGPPPTVPEPGGPGGTTPTTTPGGPVTHPTVPTTVPGPGGGQTPSTTVPGSGATTSTTVAVGGGDGQPGATTTTVPGGTGPTTSTTTPGPGGGTPTTPTTVPDPDGPTTSTTTPPPGGPGSGTPDETPTPDPDSDGPWHLTGAAPRVAPTAGGTPVTFTGTFPTGRDLYVWFGSTPVTARSYNSTTIVVATPPRPTAGIVDLSVRFRDGTVDRVLTLSDAFTYSDSTPGTGGGGTTPTTTPGPGGGSPPTTTPGGGTTPTTSPGGGTTPTTAGQIVRDRDGLTLRTPAAGSAIAGLRSADFSSTCGAAVCVARRS